MTITHRLVLDVLVLRCVVFCVLEAVCYRKVMTESSPESVLGLGRGTLRLGVSFPLWSSMTVPCFTSEVISIVRRGGRCKIKFRSSKWCGLGGQNVCGYVFGLMFAF